MKKSLLIAVAVLCTAATLTGCTTGMKARSFDAQGGYASETGQLAIGKVHVDAVPESVDSAIVHYAEDVALFSSTKTHRIDIILTGTNSVSCSSNIVDSICRAFISVAPRVSEINAGAPVGRSSLEVTQETARSRASAKAQAAPDLPASKDKSEGCAEGDCTDGDRADGDTCTGGGAA